MSRSIKTPFPRTGGLVLGWSKDLRQIYYTPEDTHSLIIGATRCGKSRHVVLPSIGLTAMAGESMVIVDPKSELYLYTRPFLERLGYEVITIDFKEPDRGNRYNFLQPVLDAVYMGDLSLAVSCAGDIANLLVPDKEGTTTDPLWTNGERSILTAAILAACLEFEKPQWQNLSNAWHFITTMCASDGAQQQIPLIPYLEKLPEDSPLRRAMGIAKISPEKMRGSFYSSALAMGTGRSAGADPRQCGYPDLTAADPDQHRPRSRAAVQNPHQKRLDLCGGGRVRLRFSACSF